MDKSGQSVMVGLIAVVLVGILVVGFLSLSRVDKLLRNQAVDGCVKVAAEVEDGVFRGDVYNTCLKDKGY